jgi:hypothetical protein
VMVGQMHAEGRCRVPWTKEGTQKSEECTVSNLERIYVDSILSGENYIPSPIMGNVPNLSSVFLKCHVGFTTSGRRSLFSNHRRLPKRVDIILIYANDIRYDVFKKENLHEKDKT